MTTSSIVAPCPPAPRSLLELAQRVAREVGQEIAGRRKLGELVVSTKSSATDMVTELDGAAEALIAAALGHARPDDGLLGEEGTVRTGRTGIDWVVDPIDGTTNFLYDLPGWAVSIAAVDERRPGGWRRLRAHDGRVVQRRTGPRRPPRTGARSHCSTKTDLATALVGTGFSYQPGRRGEQGMVVAALLPRVRDIRRFGAASVDLCSVAAGRLDAYFEEGLAPWDLAAGEIIAREAGAVLSDLDGGPVRPGSVVACPPALHRPFLDLLGARLGPPR